MADGRLSEEFPHLPAELVAEALSEWFYPRPVPDGPMPERLRRVLRVVDAAHLAAVLTPDTYAPDQGGGRG